MDHGLGQRETLGDRLGRLADPKKPARDASLEIGGTYGLFLKPGWINLPLWTQTWKFVKCFPDILAAAEKAKSGSEFFVATNGNIER